MEILEYQVQSTEKKKNHLEALSTVIYRKVQLGPSQFNEQRMHIFCFKRGAADGLCCQHLPLWYLSLRSVFVR